MRADRASSTALRVATHRAAHQLLDHPKVFDDSLALAVLGPEAAEALSADPRQAETSPISRFLRAFVAARSRFAEDELARAVERGVSQYVVLGAGLDTFAYRSPYPSGALRIFEVDHPATQQWKKGLLSQAGITPPPELTFAPVDFQRQALDDGLRAAGLDPRQATFFAWLGVTPYLPPKVVFHTLAQIARYSAGSGLVFDYPLPPELLDARGQKVFEILSGWSGESGEPWLASFDPAVMGRKLDSLGFGHVEDLGQAEINARYFAGRADGLQVGSLYRLVSAGINAEP